MKTNLVSCGAGPTRITARRWDAGSCCVNLRRWLLSRRELNAYNTDLREAPASLGTQGTNSHHSTIGQRGRLKMERRINGWLSSQQSKRLITCWERREMHFNWKCSCRCIWLGQARQPRAHKTGVHETLDDPRPHPIMLLNDKKYFYYWF